MENTLTNEVKAKIKKGLPTAGSWLQSCSNILAEVLASAGFDWLLIDMEHSPLGFEQLLGIIQAMKGCPAVPFVRAPWNDKVAIKRILDTGAYGILVPYVNNRQEAEMAVAACKFPTQGVRGVAGSVRAADYGAGKERMNTINDEICVITQIETPESVDNLTDMMKVEGLDGFFIGPVDLAASMGHMGDTGHEDVQKAIKYVEDTVIGSGKFLGTISGSWEEAERLFKRGYQFVTLMSDTTTMGAVARRNMSMFLDQFGG